MLENEKVNILWDFHIQSDHVIEHCILDLLLVDKILDREQDNMQYLKTEIKKNWNLQKVTIVPVVVGTVNKNFYISTSTQSTAILASIIS